MTLVLFLFSLSSVLADELILRLPHTFSLSSQQDNTGGQTFAGAFSYSFRSGHIGSLQAYRSNAIGDDTDGVPGTSGFSLNYSTNPFNDLNHSISLSQTRSDQDFQQTSGRYTGTLASDSYEISGSLGFQRVGLLEVDNTQPTYLTDPTLGVSAAYFYRHLSFSAEIEHIHYRTDLTVLSEESVASLFTSNALILAQSLASTTAALSIGYDLSRSLGLNYTYTSSVAAVDSVENQSHSLQFFARLARAYSASLEAGQSTSSETQSTFTALNLTYSFY